MDNVKSIKLGRLLLTKNLNINLLRLFLGVTWIFAGWSKATDLGYLLPTSNTYIGKTLLSYTQHSPISSLITPALDHAWSIGVFVMLAEFAIGYATLVGVLPIFSALMGALMSLGLFLASSFYVRPYFLGSDLPYMLLWVLYALSLLNLKEPIIEIHSQKVKSTKYPTRRSILKVSSVSLLTIFTPFIGKFLTPEGKVKSKTSGKVSKEIIKVANLAVGDSLAFTSKTGSPAVLFRSKVGVFAYLAVCTHQGCTVAYEPFSKSLQCPCHGASFDPFNQARVLSGPAPRPLDSIKVTIIGESVVEI